MKKIVFIFCVGLLATALLITNAHAACDHWYIRHSGNGDAPACDARFDYLDLYNAYYMDKRAAKETKNAPILYLTFDAGYENGNIEKILNVLKDEDVPAAFFVLQNMAYKAPGLLRRMAEEGHMICNHTAHHCDVTQLSKSEFEAELKEMEKVYDEKIGGCLSPYFRPPEGTFNEQVLEWAQSMGYTTVLWSFAYPDWDNEKQPDPDWAKKKILSNTHDGAIVLLHPNSATNAKILRDLIKEWRNMGYEFGTLDMLRK